MGATSRMRLPGQRQSAGTQAQRPPSSGGGHPGNPSGGGVGGEPLGGRSNNRSAGGPTWGAQSQSGLEDPRKVERPMPQPFPETPPHHANPPQSGGGGRSNSRSGGPTWGAQSQSGLENPRDVVARKYNTPPPSFWGDAEGARALDNYRRQMESDYANADAAAANYPQSDGDRESPQGPVSLDWLGTGINGDVTYRAPSWKNPNPGIGFEYSPKSWGGWGVEGSLYPGLGEGMDSDMDNRWGWDVNTPSFDAGDLGHWEAFGGGSGNFLPRDDWTSYPPPWDWVSQGAMDYLSRTGHHLRGGIRGNFGDGWSSEIFYEPDNNGGAIGSPQIGVGFNKRF